MSYSISPQDFIQQKNYPKWTHVTTVREGAETPLFKQNFTKWVGKDEVTSLPTGRVATTAKGDSHSTRLVNQCGVCVCNRTAGSPFFPCVSCLFVCFLFVCVCHVCVVCVCVCVCVFVCLCVSLIRGNGFSIFCVYFVFVYMYVYVCGSVCVHVCLHVCVYLLYIRRIIIVVSALKN